VEGCQVRRSVRLPKLDVGVRSESVAFGLKTLRPSFLHGFQSHSVPFQLDVETPIPAGRSPLDVEGIPYLILMTIDSMAVPDAHVRAATQDGGLEPGNKYCSGSVDFGDPSFTQGNLQTLSQGRGPVSASQKWERSSGTRDGIKPK
jgi:hypothetical protein